MGEYLNPRTESKENFLIREGTPIPDAPEWPLPAGKVAVCLVVNAGFTAAGIADTEREIQRFVRGMSGRPHQWFLVDAERVRVANA